jgi:hypothetical protein
MKDIGKFTNVPVEEDTIIRRNTLIDLDGLQALHQDWVWDGIAAESLVFIADEVAQLDDDKITLLALSSRLPRVGSKFTIARERVGYTFINFNFLCD